MINYYSESKKSSMYPFVTNYYIKDHRIYINFANYIGEFSLLYSKTQEEEVLNWMRQQAQNMIRDSYELDFDETKDKENKKKEVAKYKFYLENEEELINKFGITINYLDLYSLEDLVEKLNSYSLKHK